eukprot:8132634-Alexandrium_andersonii.AAC.1
MCIRDRSSPPLTQDHCPPRADAQDAPPPAADAPRRAAATRPREERPGTPIMPLTRRTPSWPPRH